jgi:dienelactone hydrolase
LHACVPTSELGSPWPTGVPLQIHVMDADEWAKDDVVVARELATTIESAASFLYPGSQHLVADNSLDGYDQQAAELLMTRVLTFLEDIDRRE